MTPAELRMEELDRQMRELVSCRLDDPCAYDHTCQNHKAYHALLLAYAEAVRAGWADHIKLENVLRGVLHHIRPLHDCPECTEARRFLPPLDPEKAQA